MKKITLAALFACSVVCYSSATVAADEAVPEDPTILDEIIIILSGGGGHPTRPPVKN